MEEGLEAEGDIEEGRDRLAWVGAGEVAQLSCIEEVVLAVKIWSTKVNVKFTD